MGEYDPHSPYIIGNEWVPIRQADFIPDNSLTEHGYTFTLQNSATVVSGSYYTQAGTGSGTAGVAELISVYPAGSENQSGPIKSVTIPCSAVSVTGVILGSANCAGWLFGGGLGNAAVGISFDVTSYAQALNGKRILDVSVDYVAVGGTETSLSHAQMYVAKLANIGGGSTYQAELQGTVVGASTIVSSTSLSEINPWWEPGVTAISAPVPTRTLPWRYQELANFGTAATADRMIVGFSCDLTLDPSGYVSVGSVVLRVTYCEEQRVLYGGDLLYSTGITATSNLYQTGGKMVMLRTPTFAIPGTLPAGNYTVAHSHVEIGRNDLVRPAPYMRALRELYQLPSQKGIKITRATKVDSEFSNTASNVLEHVTLHTAAGIVTGSHAYGTRIAAPVYGTITAIQEIEDDPAGASKQYPQVRFYARRFGETTASLRLIDVATTTSTVSITPAEFDALPGIVDGWKEVNLRFTTVPSFATAAGDIDWRWDAVGETAGNQWQILGADGPSITGAQSTGPATYSSPTGDTVALNWQSPLISGTAEDALSDATLIFSTDPPTITGFALSTCTQQITGISMSCGVPAGCIPTGIYGNQVSWTNSTVCDTFSRTVSSQWGTADTGQSWAVTGGAGSDYNVALGIGTHTITGTAVPHQGFITINRDAQDVRCGPIIIPAVPTGASIEAGILIRRNTTAGNWYSANLTISTAAVTTLSLTRNISGTITSLGSAVLPLAHTPGSRYYVRAQAVDSIIKVKAWTADNTEPGWMITVTDTGIPTGTQAGVRSILNTSNTNAPLTISFDNFQAVQADLADGRYEIQRFDSIDNAWSTVFDTSNICVTGFCDFEARTGVASIYRMRTRNVLDFSGPWVSGSATLPSPGIAGTSGTGMLIFTSNKQPLSNLAYVMQFDGKPVETFTFPEADTVSLLRMYGKDFFTAFRPLERGGDKFQRTLLVSAAAIALPSMAGFTNLRDLAWADLPYVCVRDELGNRWYATVIVPSGGVTRHRTLYFAQIEVVQATNTPYPAIS